MASLISKFVIKILCDNQGCLDFQRLDEAIAQSFTVDKSVLRGVLFDDGKIAIQAGSKKLPGGQITGPDSLIVAKTSLRICQKKTGECLGCDGLHLCRYFVCGECTFGSKCKNPHRLADPYNQEILKRYSLHDLTEKQLFQLLLQNDPFLLPEVCGHYNKGNGLHGSCKFTTTCTKLHVCLHYLQGDCKFGSSCKRAHNIDAQGMKLLRGFSKENIANLFMTYRNKFIITGQQERPAAVISVLKDMRISIPQPSHLPSQNNFGSPTSSACPSKALSDADRNEICLYFIRRHCGFKDKCARVHWHLPYRWQVLDSDGVTWKDLVNMEDIEKAYCDPAHDTSCTDQPSAASGLFKLLSYASSAPPTVQSVDFVKMTYGGSPVRRISTASSVSKPPHYILTTQWLWYWKDDGGKWKEFGQDDSDDTVTSQTLENVYLADQNTEIPFKAGKQQYVLHFKDAAGAQQMYQENVKFNTKREVRRRPRFVSAHDVEVQLKSASPQSSSTAEIVPSYWDKNALPEFGFKLIPLPKSAKEHNRIEMLFKLTMPQGKISSIQRIQNPSLWKVFQWQKDQMKDRNGGNLVNEQYLFHGTDESLIEAICEQNFDWRMCGVHGTAYGKGSYFAKDASYSDRYAKIRGTLNKIMFVALVLVGEYTKGKSSYVRPPPKGGSWTLYDSCVDSESNPSIYVIFDKQQIYPEYLINYS
ncbi:protein mono-ADP-ribosyltransferase PARP12 isoform X2 [Acanthochromis polyacanthus]|uniref:protein mono-ADP-ribosyltransferase PARP12 isoform X2 n=1 Tax=Acanthochromis polyacanthus TaxID=80966 RepID=UPI002234AE3B|nr:protein mono-ADP-ribosyltransferase PARP12 isoform X2 [Acanthochromis polyacanthus]